MTGRPPLPPGSKRGEMLRVRLNEQEAAALDALGSDRSATIRELVEDAPLLESLHASVLEELRGRFSAPELSAILDANNGTWLTPELLGQHVALNVHDTEGLSAKWGIDQGRLVARLSDLRPAQAAALELWSRDLWREPEADWTDAIEWLAGSTG